jgi:pyridoxine 4-dehydrogenase
VATVTAGASGTFRLGGELEVHRLGFGAMRITGEGIWGPPPDHDRALAVLRRARELEVDFLDTADSYGPYVSEDLIAEALHPYDGTVVATKAGLVRTGPSEWWPVGRPEYLRQCLEMSLRRLRVDTIDLWQLHRIDPQVPREEQFGVLKEAVDAGKVRFVGLSEVGVEEIEAAREVVPVATVQNLYNLTSRQHEDVVAFCEANDIGFIPWFPLAAGTLAKPGEVLAEAAEAHGASPGQVALAWLLRRSPAMLPIPGTGSVEHLEENVAAGALELTDEQFAAIDAATRP